MQEKRTSLALAGHMMASSGSPRSRAAASTGEGLGTRFLPRPLGRPGCDTTPATCQAAHHYMRIDLPLAAATRRNYT